MKMLYYHAYEACLANFGDDEGSDIIVSIDILDKAWSLPRSIRDNIFNIEVCGICYSKVHKRGVLYRESQ